MSDFISLIQKRRSIYNLGQKSDISQKKIIQTITECIKQTPSAFNSQTGRIVVLFNSPYKEFWISTKNTLKKITPHKLRSTFGTELYRATGDIYVVADVLGHKDVNTTKKHYAAISEDIRREASLKVKLHKDDND